MYANSLKYGFIKCIDWERKGNFNEVMHESFVSYNRNN